MGKRTKRGRNSGAAAAGAVEPPSSAPGSSSTSKSSRDNYADTNRETRRPRTEAASTHRNHADEEGPDNLRFEDPFPDVYEDEEVMGGGGGNDDEDGDEGWSDADDDEDIEDDDEEGAENNRGSSGMEDAVQAWNPFSTDDTEQQQGVKLEMDPTAYKLHHALTPEWPSLSVDFVRDSLGVRANTKFPHSIICAVGTQADRPGDNRVTIMKLSDLGRIHAETEDDILGEEYDPNGGNDNDDSDDDDSNDEEDMDDADMDPVVEHYSIKHYGGVNRIRSMPQNPNVVATWSDAGKVNLFHIQSILQRFETSAGATADSSAGGGGSNSNKLPLDIPSKPQFSYAKHNTEGFAMDWSSVEAGQLATGDCHGGIHLWNPRSDGTYAISKSYDDASRKNGQGDDALLASSTSVEDLQWSPTEKTVLASAECGGYVRIYDSRAPNRAMLSHMIHDNRSDVNVLSWNKLVPNLLATGSDDGVLSVWDLRHFAASSSTSASKAPHPLARFTPHTTPITSVEWHPTDESMLVVTDDKGAYVYDLSVEEDDTADNDDDDMATTGPALPPQLLFVHCGSEQFKEAHWHPQIPSLVMTTALSGYSVFIPSNL
jgi:ribosome assembly protein RRB1